MTKLNFMSYRLQYEAGFLLLFDHSVLVIIFRHFSFSIQTKIVIMLI